MTAAERETLVSRLLALDRLGAEKILAQARAQHAPLRVAEQVVVPALEDIGRGWEQGQVALAQVYMSSKICEELIDRFLPRSSPDRISQPKIAIAQLDDYHSLGKTIIQAALRAAGYAVRDYGRMNAAELAQRICKESIGIILISALMLRSALQVKKVSARLAAAGSPAKIIVGGAPFRFDPELWREVGAHGMGSNAAEAIRVVSCCLEECR